MRTSVNSIFTPSQAIQDPEEPKIDHADPHLDPGESLLLALPIKALKNDSALTQNRGIPLFP
jgi:hypothetical protein